MIVRQEPAKDTSMNIYGAIVPQRIRLDLRPRDKAQLLTLLAAEAASATGVGAEVILSALRKREDLGSTGVGHGIAMPHAALPGVAGAFCLFARLDRALDYGAVDDRPVDIVVLLLTPQNNPSAGLSALSAAARTLRSGDVPKMLRKAASGTDVQAIWSDPV